MKHVSVLGMCRPTLSQFYATEIPLKDNMAFWYKQNP